MLTRRHDPPNRLFSSFLKFFHQGFFLYAAANHSNRHSEPQQTFFEPKLSSCCPSHLNWAPCFASVCGLPGNACAQASPPPCSLPLLQLSIAGYAAPSQLHHLYCRWSLVPLAHLTGSHNSLPPLPRHAPSSPLPVGHCHRPCGSRRRSDGRRRL